MTAPPFPGYLGVRYAVEKRPYTDYPSRLATHLTKEYLAPRSRLLDLGCGRGELSNAFRTAGLAVTSVDREVFPGLQDVVRCDFGSGPIPFEAGVFDVVFSKSVFEHVWDTSHLLAECWRILAPGGRIITLVPDFPSQWRHFYDDWTHVRPFTLTGLRESHEAHGFRVHTAKHFRQLPFLWDRPFLRPLADAASLLPSSLKTWKLVRFAKEWMLLVVADKVASLSPYPNGTSRPCESTPEDRSEGCCQHLTLGHRC